MLQEFCQMWTELLEELVNYILDQPTVQSAHSLNHLNLDICDDVPAGCDPQPLDQVSMLCIAVSYKQNTAVKVLSPQHS